MKGLTDQAPSFALGSPLFDKITIRLNDRYYKGKEFVIETRNIVSKMITCNPWT